MAAPNVLCPGHPRWARVVASAGGALHPRPVSDGGIAPQTHNRVRLDVGDVAKSRDLGRALRSGCSATLSGVN